MDALTILPYGGISVLAFLLVVFELTNAQQGNGTPRNGYQFFTADGSCVRIRHIFGRIYKVYPEGDCPVRTETDRYGRFFRVKAKSASEAEYRVDRVYGSQGGV